jgi:phage head maturation protease
MGMPPLLQVGIRYEIWQPAGTFEVPCKGEFQQQFAPGAFDRSVGKVVPLKIESRPVGHARVVSAEVAQDGSGVTFTYEIVDLEP